MTTKLVESKNLCLLSREDCNVREILKEVGSPSHVVFCHNDLQEGNILFNDNETDPVKKMTIIDCEFGNYNYRAFDLANHFCEWAICYDGATFHLEPENYPLKHKRYDFFRHYLIACGQETVSEKDLKDIEDETKAFAMASHFLWATWSVVQAYSSNIDFCFWDYAVSRFKEHFRLMRDYKKRQQMTFNER